MRVLDHLFAVIDTFEDYTKFQLSHHNQIRSLNTIPKSIIVSTIHDRLFLRIQDLQQDSIRS
jgi:hypothetical protein